MLSRAQNRLQKELKDMRTNFPQFSVALGPGEDILTWRVSFLGAEGTVYAGEQFCLQFKFDGNYPIESPDVIFVDHVPEHEHIYSNGYICLSILYDDWSPSLRVSSVVLSILSMLSSATHKTRPHNDSSFIRYAGGRRPKSFSWVFEDNKC
mmetsp:Transcript_690/g.1241  ORF Transcript_690/g.1241 Transcript_690/m.1241 type:complete len:151 (+) Transcript_690:2731-3183(+)